VLSLRSVKWSLHAPRSRSRHGAPFRIPHLASRSTPPSTCTSTTTNATSGPQQHSHTNPTPAHLTFRSPIALSSYHPNPTHDSSAPGRGFMSSGAAQLPRQRGGRCRHRGAVIGCRAPQTLQPERGWAAQPAPPSSWPSRMSGRRPRRSSLSPPCGRPSTWSRWTSSVQATGVHPTGVIQVSGQPGVRCPWPLRPRCPDGAGSRTSVPRDRPRWRTGFDVSRWSERLGRRRPNPAWRGRMVDRWQCLAGHECRRQTWAAASRSHRLRRRARRLADQGSWSSARVPVGWLGSTRGSRCSQVPRRCVLGRLPACCSTWGWTGRW
jgi:hypothetical protein